MNSKDTYTGFRSFINTTQLTKVYHDYNITYSTWWL